MSMTANAETLPAETLTPREGVGTRVDFVTVGLGLVEFEGRMVIAQYLVPRCTIWGGVPADNQWAAPLTPTPPEQVPPRESGSGEPAPQS